MDLGHAICGLSDTEKLMPTNLHAGIKMTPKTQVSSVTRRVVDLPTTRRADTVTTPLPKHLGSERHTFYGYPAPGNEVANDPSPIRQTRAIGLFYLASKRLFDLVAGSALLVVAIPIVAVAAAAIRINTPGSPFFFQTRLGKNGKPFKIFKLRGMYIDAKTRFPSYYDYSKKQDLEFCFHHEDDPRVTRAGKFIRKTSIDELPNLWNVVLGDMSLVGPRPEIPEVLALYGSYKEDYLSVKPGITCLSKCTGRDRLTKRETIEFDLDYIRNRSFARDLVILWLTFRSVMLRRDVF